MTNNSTGNSKKLANKKPTGADSVTSAATGNSKKPDGPDSVMSAAIGNSKKSAATKNAVDPNPEKIPTSRPPATTTGGVQVATAAAKNPTGPPAGLRTTILFVLALGALAIAATVTHVPGRASTTNPRRRRSNSSIIIRNKEGNPLSTSVASLNPLFPTAFGILGVDAACTQLADVTPAVGQTVTVQSGECSGFINVVNNDVTIDIQSGAERFQLGKSIVLPTSGAIVNLNLRVTGVNWGTVTPLSIPLFSGGHTTNFELQGALFDFKGNTITSTSTNTIGFMGKFTTSRYTLSTTTLNVTTTYAFHAYAFQFWGAFTNSTLSITDGSQVTATSPKGNAYTIWFYSNFTDSRLDIAHGSQVTATSTVGNCGHCVAWAIWFNSYTIWFFTNSTICITDDSQVTAATIQNSTTDTIYPSTVHPSTIASECPTATVRTRTTTAAGTAAAATTTAAATTETPLTNPDGKPADPWGPASDHHGAGASAVTAAALGLVTMVLAAL